MFVNFFLGMSLKFMSRALQGMKDQASKCDATVKSLRDSSCSSSSTQARLFSGGFDSAALKAANNEKVKQAEESFRTVMYLSCWGPN